MQVIYSLVRIDIISWDIEFIFQSCLSFRKTFIKQGDTHTHRRNTSSSRRKETVEYTRGVTRKKLPVKSFPVILREDDTEPSVTFCSSSLHHLNDVSISRVSSYRHHHTVNPVEVYARKSLICHYIEKVLMQRSRRLSSQRSLPSIDWKEEWQA